jgi:hypothetical protein
MVFGRHPWPNAAKGHVYERFFRLFPFGRILPNGNKLSSHFRHSVAVLLASQLGELCNLRNRR